MSRVDIGNRTVYPPVKVNVTTQDKGVGRCSLFYLITTQVLHVKKLVGAVFGDDQRASVPSRLVLQVSDQYSRNFKILDVPSAIFRDVLRETYMTVPLVRCPPSRSHPSRSTTMAACRSRRPSRPTGRKRPRKVRCSRFWTGRSLRYH